jgi:hypothetical protein
MVPPYSGGGEAINSSAPLAKWHVYKSFDSATECEQARIAIQRGRYDDKTFTQAAILSACIQSDDSRLAK